MSVYSISPRGIAEATPASMPESSICDGLGKIALLTGGFDKPYVYGLAMALSSIGIQMDIVGGDSVDCKEFHTSANINFLHLRRNPDKDAGAIAKLAGVLAYYTRLVRYAATSNAKMFHVIWNNRFHSFDRTLLMLYYKMLGKKIVFTAHNINAGVRDSSDSAWNRWTLKIQYHLSDHIFVHTEKMKHELMKDFKVRESAVSVIPFGINNAVPDTHLTRAEARSRLGVGATEKTLLFFGRIGAYKGLVYLVEAFQQVLERFPDARLIIVGKLRGDAERYASEIFKTIDLDIQPGRVLRRIEFVPDEETEIYFKAADAFVLPYTFIAQSGVMFLGYSFGVPAIATDVGSFSEDIVEGRTGFLCRPCDSLSLATAIETYFESDLYRNLDANREFIRQYANERHSWNVVAEKTINIYRKTLGVPTTSSSLASN